MAAAFAAALLCLAAPVAAQPDIAVTGVPVPAFAPWDITNGPSPGATVRVTNSGTSTLTFTGDKVRVVGDAAFDVWPRAAALSTLAPAAFVDFTVMANPDAVGPISANLEFITDAISTPVFSTPLSGSGAAPVPHDWDRLAGTSRGMGRQFIGNLLTDLVATEWSTGPEGLITDGSIVVLPGTPDLVVAWGTSGADVVVKAFNARHGTPVWTSPALSAGNTVAFGSWHTAAADAATHSVLMATGTMMYRLNGDTGAIEWDEPLDDGGSTDLVNGSVTVGGGRAYVTSFGGFAPAGKRLYAFDIADGSVDWSVQDGGPGSEAPVYVNNGMGAVVFTLLDNGVAAYDAVTGAVRWTNAAPLAGAPWATTHDFFGGLTYFDGVLLAPTNNFAGNSELVAVDAWTGELLWNNPSVVTGSATPAVVGGRAYIVGSDFFGGPAYLEACDLVTGAQFFKVQMTTASTMWNTSAIAYNDAIVLTRGSDDFFPGAPVGLRIVSPLTGADLVAETASSMLSRGTPAIGKDSRLYVLRAGGGLAMYLPPGVPVTLSAIGLE